jgi:hypothetical protein
MRSAALCPAPALVRASHFLPRRGGTAQTPAAFLPIFEAIRARSQVFRPVFQGVERPADQLHA